MAKKILIIDDEEPVCLLVKSILQRQGVFEVFYATRGMQGIELAAKKKPDAIILDIVMPGMSGSEVAQKLLETNSTKEIPIIFLSALADKGEVSARDGHIGGRTFIAKPVTPEELLSRIREVLPDEERII